MTKVIWTNHLKERIQQRGLSPGWVDTAVRFPDEVQKSTTTDSQKHIKIIQGYKIVAAVKREHGDWIVTSAWWNPVYGNTPTKTGKRFFLEKLIDSGLRFLEKKLFKK